MDRREFLAASAVAAAFVITAAPRRRRRRKPPRGGRERGRGREAGDGTADVSLRLACEARGVRAFMARRPFPRSTAGVRRWGRLSCWRRTTRTAKPPVTRKGRDLYVLLPHASAAAVLAWTRSWPGTGVQEAGRDVLMAPKADPAYTRYETSLLLGFDQCPRVEVPTTADTRVLQMRMYESHSRERNRKKVAMFNEGGEIAIFRRCGMNPVFFGEAVAGPRMPNLTYMLGFEDEAALKKGWDAFRADPEWKKLSADPAYADTVSQITNLVLRPAAGSQV